MRVNPDEEESKGRRVCQDKIKVNKNPKLKINEGCVIRLKLTRQNRRDEESTITTVKESGEFKDRSGLEWTQRSSEDLRGSDGPHQDGGVRYLWWILPAYLPSCSMSGPPNQIGYGEEVPTYTHTNYHDPRKKKIKILNLINRVFSIPDSIIGRYHSSCD